MLQVWNTYLHVAQFLGIPSGNQTWLAGESAHNGGL